MPPGSPATAVASMRPGVPEQVGSRAMSGQLVPGRAVAPTYICPIKAERISLDRKIARHGSGSLQAVERLAKTPKGGAERAVSRQTADQRIGRRALAGRRLARLEKREGTRAEWLARLLL